jgi:hypothetical protein
MSQDGDVTYGAHQWDSYTFSSAAKAIAEERSLLDPGQDPPALELGWIEGSQRGDGFLPIPSKTGKGWGFVGSTAADYNRFFRQSINDPSTIQGATGAWSFLNGTPKWVDLIGSNVNDAVAFSIAHPDALCVVRGFHTFGTWAKAHGGDDSLQPRAAVFRNGTTVSFPPQPYTGTSTGLLVIGALALAAGGLAATSALASSGGAVASSTSVATDVADTAPAAEASSEEVVATTAETTSGSLGGETGGIFSGAQGVLSDTSGAVAGATGAAGAAKTLGSLLGAKSSGAPNALPSNVGGNTASGQSGTTSSAVLLYAAAAAVLFLLIARR